MLHCKVTPNTDKDPSAVIKQLVVPEPYRAQLLALEHDFPAAGHFGVRKTQVRVLETFFWSRVLQHVKHYKASCDTFQRIVKPSQKVPLCPLPVIGEQFVRVAIDLVGPLPISSHTGKTYILTLVDLATRYPKTVALSSMDPENVAQALADLFSSVEYPQEVVTDQGTQFQGELLQILRPQHTTPYHPQTKRLVSDIMVPLNTSCKLMCRLRGKIGKKPCSSSSLQVGRCPRSLLVSLLLSRYMDRKSTAP